MESTIVSILIVKYHKVQIKIEFDTSSTSEKIRRNKPSNINKDNNCRSIFFFFKKKYTWRYIQ